MDEEVVGGRLRRPAPVRRHGHVPCPARFRRKAHPHQVDRAGVHARRLGVERERRHRLQRCREFARRRLGRHESVVVRPVGEGREDDRLRRRIGRGRGEGRGRHGERAPQEALREAVQLVLRADGGDPFPVERRAGEGIPVDLPQRHIPADRREELRHLRVLGPGGDPLAEPALDLARVGDDLLHAAILGEQCTGRLFADALDSGDVVRRVAREGEVVDHLRGGGERPVLLHARLVVDGRTLLAVAGAEEADVRPHELRGVLVRRRAVHLEALLRRPRRERAHHVVGLEALLADDGEAQRLGELEGVGDVRREVFGHLLPLRLVRRIRLVAERGPAGVHREHRVRGLVFAEDGGDAVRETDEGGDVEPRARHARTAQEHEMPPVEERHEVDDEKLLHAG